MADIHPLTQIRDSDLYVMRLLSGLTTHVYPYSNAARRFLKDLPSLKPEDVPEDEYCPICLLTFKSILEEQSEYQSKQEGTSNAEPSETRISLEDVGVVKLSGCGHIFCRRE